MTDNLQPPDVYLGGWNGDEFRGYSPTTVRRLLDEALALWPRDCRLCAHYRPHAPNCVSVIRCEDSSAYKATQPVQMWATVPAGPALF